MGAGAGQGAGTGLKSGVETGVEKGRSNAGIGSTGLKSGVEKGPLSIPDGPEPEASAHPRIDRRRPLTGAGPEPEALGTRPAARSALGSKIGRRSGHIMAGLNRPSGRFYHGGVLGRLLRARPRAKLPPVRRARAPEPGNLVWCSGASRTPACDSERQDHAEGCQSGQGKASTTPARARHTRAPVCCRLSCIRSPLYMIHAQSAAVCPSPCAGTGHAGTRSPSVPGRNWQETAGRKMGGCTGHESRRVHSP
jgi:hypothetical protein